MMCISMQVKHVVDDETMMTVPDRHRHITLYLTRQKIRVYRLFRKKTIFL